jgi:hypothetical protein
MIIISIDGCSGCLFSLSSRYLLLTGELTTLLRKNRRFAVAIALSNVEDLEKCVTQVVWSPTSRRTLLKGMRLYKLLEYGK